MNKFKDNHILNHSKIKKSKDRVMDYQKIVNLK